MKVGDLVKLRKSHPSVQRWRTTARRYGSPAIGLWAEEGAPLLLLKKRDCSRWEVLGPGGDLASFDDDLLTTRGMK